MIDGVEIRCVCHSCSRKKVVTESEKAQSFFDAHADKGHEVELVNITATEQVGED